MLLIPYNLYNDYWDLIEVKHILYIRILKKIHKRDTFDHNKAFLISQRLIMSVYQPMRSCLVREP